MKLIEALVRDGLRVGSLKHTDHEYETDAPGKDSQRHKAAGAEPAVLVAGRRSAVHRADGEFLLRTRVRARRGAASGRLYPFS